MVNQEVSKRKATGSHFTPDELGRFVARRIMATKMVTFDKPIVALDPACGDGELLIALADVLSSQQRGNLDLIGIDAEKTELNKANNRLNDIGVRKVDLRLADFLEICERSLSGNNGQDNNLIGTTDVIIANPPYVRTQVLGAKKSQELATIFGLTGRVDLYHAFLIAMTYCLKPGGVLGVITSNRFISTKGGNTLRQFLAQAYDIIEIIDLGDTKLFDAAVLPSVFIGIRKGEEIFYSKQEARFSKIYETKSISPNKEFQETDTIYTCLENERSGTYAIGRQYFEVSSGIVRIPVDATAPWMMVTDSERGWIEKINANSWKRIQDITKVRVGVKTTADTVFIRKDWMNLTIEILPEEELLLPLYSNEDAERWSPITQKANLKRILYTHQVNNGKRIAIDLNKYPYAATYLKSHYQRLAGRKYVIDAKRNWYEIWVPQDPTGWASPKIVFPDISQEPRFFYDNTGAIVDGNCYWITLEDHIDSDLLFLILGIANTKIMTRYHDLVFNNKLYAGRRRYLTQYVEKYPLPNPDLVSSKHIISIAKALSLEDLNQEKKSSLELLLELSTAEAFGIEPMD